MDVGSVNPASSDQTPKAEAKAKATETPDPEQPTKMADSERATNWILDTGLFVAACVSGIFVCRLLWIELISQQGVYRSAIELASKHNNDDLIINYARALDFATVKLSTVLLGFILAFLGALYVLRIQASVFKGSVTSTGTGGTIETSSPGLVMLTLGVVAVICSLFSKSYLANESAGAVRNISAGVSTAQTGGAVPGNVPPQQAEAKSVAKKKKSDQQPLALSQFLNISGSTDNLTLAGCHDGDFTTKGKAILDQEVKRLQELPHQNLMIAAQLDASAPSELRQSLAEGCADSAKSYMASELRDNTRTIRVLSYGKEKQLTR